MKFFAPLVILSIFFGCSGTKNNQLGQIEKTKNISIEVIEVDAVNGKISFVLDNKNDTPYWLNTHKMFWIIKVRDVLGENIRKTKKIEQGSLPKNTKKFVLIPAKSMHKLELETNFLTQYDFRNDRQYQLSTEYFNVEKYEDKFSTIIGRLESTTKTFKIQK